MQPSGFEDKLLAKLDKLDPDQLQAYLIRQRAQKQFLLSVFDHLDEGIIVTDGELRILFVNRRARSMLGWPRDRTSVGERLDERIAEDHPLYEIIHSLKNDLRSIEGYEFSSGAREERTLSLSTLPMPVKGAGERIDEEENLLIVLLHDVTERHRRQSEQARLRRLASMATLTAGIAHEIKNPLNSLNIHAQLLSAEVRQATADARSPDLAKTERATRVIMEETKRLRHVVEQFIQAARPKTPRLELRELRPLLESAERIFRPECEQAGIHLVLSIDPDLPPLMIDDHQLLQAVRNLLRNAIEALGERLERTRQSGEHFEPRLELAARLEGDRVRILVSDNGPGIADSALEHIFEPYYSTKFGGSGLGLMVVYRIVSEHRGSLHVDTQPGGGTRFIISLPLSQRPVRLLGHQTGETPASINELRKP